MPFRFPCGRIGCVSALPVAAHEFARRKRRDRRDCGERDRCDGSPRRNPPAVQTFPVLDACDRRGYLAGAFRNRALPSQNRFAGAFAQSAVAVRRDFQYRLLQFLRAAHLNDALPLEKIAHYGAEVLRVGPHDCRLAAEARFYHVLASVRTKRFADEHYVGKRIERHQLACRVRKQNFAAGTGRNIAARTADAGEAGLDNVLLHGIRLFEMARRDREQGVVGFAENGQQYGILARPSRSAKNDGAAFPVRFNRSRIDP